MRIDSHQHFWRIDRGDYGWLNHRLLRIYRDFGPRDLAPLLHDARVDATILVQAAPTDAETRYILGIAERTPFVGGVIGWMDFDARDVERRIAELASNPLVVGLRPMVSAMKDDDWLLRRELRYPIQAMIAHGLVFDAMIQPHHISRLFTVAKEWPELHFVINHAAKPPIGDGVPRAWFEDIAQLARLGNVSCKFSGLITEIGPRWEADFVQPVMRHLLSEFGAGRILWGSEWPVLNLVGDYARWVEASEKLLRPCSDAERDAIFGGNALRIYFGTRGRLAARPDSGPAG